MLPLPTPTIWFSLKHKRNVSDGVVSGVGRNGNVLILLTPDSVALMTPLPTLDFWFSLGHKGSYDSAYDSDSNSVASENQPLRVAFIFLFFCLFRKSFLWLGKFADLIVVFVCTGLFENYLQVKFKDPSFDVVGNVIFKTFRNTFRSYSLVY